MNEFTAFNTPNITTEQHTASYQWQAPSNIAIVKYWGKKSGQIPANPSLSFTLSACRTITKVSVSPKTTADQELEFTFSFEGQPKPSFEPKLKQFFERIAPYAPYLKTHRLEIDSSNTFPHSSGIASSASGMAALSLCLLSLERDLNPQMTDDYFYQKASFFARLGSGSACRSIKGQAVVWGETASIPNSTDAYGVAFPFDLHPAFENTRDAILLVDKGEKQVSSTVGHELMHGHPFAANRFAQAHTNLEQLKTILTQGNWSDFIELMESEALTLHAMMMTSRPYFILMKPNTLEIIHKIWAFRKATNLAVGFTLDAGANVHVLYADKDAVEVEKFIENELKSHCQNGNYILDKLGFGASTIV